jgi:SlyX protein
MQPVADDAVGELQLQLDLTQDQLQALELTVYRQQQQLDLLQAQLRELHRQIAPSGAGDAPAGPDDLRAELPPHY